MLSMSKQQWKTFVTGKIKHHAFKHDTNRKTMHLKYSKWSVNIFYCSQAKICQSPFQSKNKNV